MTREWAYGLIVGLALLTWGIYLTHAAMHVVPLNEKLAFGGISIAIFGALLINPTPGKPSPLMVVFKTVVVTVIPGLPWSKAQVAARKSTEVSAVKSETEREADLK